jgi:hypothetical protein
MIFFGTTKCLATPGEMDAEGYYNPPLSYSGEEIILIGGFAPNLPGVAVQLTTSAGAGVRDWDISPNGSTIWAVT